MAAYIITSNALVTIRDCLASPTMFLASSLSTLCSLLTLLGSVGAQSSSSLPSAIGPPASSPAPSSPSSLPSKFSSLLTELSSTSPGYSLTSPPTSSTSLGPPVATGGFSTIGNVLKPAITSREFVSFPAPSETSIPKVFPETYPDNPPSPGDWAIPNFGPAWAAAYEKARAMVSRFLVSPALLPFKYSRIWAVIIGSGIDARRESQYHHWSRLDERSMCWEHPTSWGFPWSLFGCMSCCFGVEFSADFESICRTLHSELGEPTTSPHSRQG